MSDLDQLVTSIKAVAPKGARRLIAVAGPPASGKSTFAQALVAKLGSNTQLVPMDGFHLDDRILEPRGLLARKGAPQTFDVDGFVALVARLQGAGSVVYPVFDRSREIAIAGAGYVGTDCDTIVIEGNYLLFDAPIWRDLSAFWDMRVFLSVDPAEIERRLRERWEAHGYSAEAARQKINENDLPNGILVQDNVVAADLVIENNG